METLNLIGITGHGRNRIREHGHRWEIIERPKRVPDWPANNLMIRSLDTGDTHAGSIQDTSKLKEEAKKNKP